MGQLADTKLKNKFHDFYSDNFRFYIKNKSVTGNFPLHWHDYFEIEIILSGKGTHHFNDRTYTIKRGSVYIVTPLDFHSMKCTSTENIDIINMKFDETVVSHEVFNIITSCGGITATLDENQLKTIIDYSQKLAEESEKPAIHSELMIKALFEALIISIMRTCDGKPSPAFSDSDDPYVKRALKYINYRFRDNITISNVAEEVGLSSNYFGEIFKIQVGLSYTEYLRKKRLEYAKSLLASGVNVHTAAEESGFSNTSYFIENFKKEYGLTPKNYFCHEKN